MDVPVSEHLMSFMSSYDCPTFFIHEFLQSKHFRGFPSEKILTEGDLTMEPKTDSRMNVMLFLRRKMTAGRDSNWKADSLKDRELSLFPSKSMLIGFSDISLKKNVCDPTSCSLF